MQEIYKNLYVGDGFDCNNSKNNNTAVVHACKTCHQKILGYSKPLSSTHEYYLIYQPNNSNLFLNLVDMKQEFLAEFTDPIMKAALQFIDNNIPNKNVLIHCNQGMSRSPSIALLWLAKKNIIDNTSYSNSKNSFSKLYNQYNPGNGIEKYLSNNWQNLIFTID